MGREKDKAVVKLVKLVTDAREQPMSAIELERLSIDVEDIIDHIVAEARHGMSKGIS